MDEYRQLLRRIITIGVLSTLVVLLVDFDFNRPIVELWEQSILELYYTWTFVTFVTYVKTFVLGILIYFCWCWHVKQAEGLNERLDHCEVLITATEPQAFGDALTAAKDAHIKANRGLGQEAAAGGGRGHRRAVLQHDGEAGKAFRVFRRLREAAEALGVPIPDDVASHRP